MYIQPLFIATFRLKTELLIYNPNMTSRFRYIVEWMFMDVLGVGVQFTSNSFAVPDSNLPVLNYSRERMGQEPFIRACGLLESSSLAMPELITVPFQDSVGLFPSSNDSLLPFDPFAACFFIITRMEEYFPTERDGHGRFTHDKSVLSAIGYLRMPVVNKWCMLLANSLKDVYPGLSFPVMPFRYLPTIDVDNAFAYAGKSIFRNLGGAVRQLGSNGLVGLAKRWSVLTGKAKDPYDTYDYLFHQFKGHEEDVRFFIHLGDRSRFDTPVSWESKRFRKLVSLIHSHFQSGIHPSYLASMEPGSQRVEMEKKRFRNLTGVDPLISRQHFLMLRFPETYRKLLAAGITADHSMGYADYIGFRAGTATPFRFFDLIANEVTDLMIYPFQAMDVTLKNYMKLSPDVAIEKVLTLMDEVKATGGWFSIIWHNESLSGTGEWKEYRKVFETINQKGFEYARS